MLHRDYFGRPDSSLPCPFAPQGLFRPPGFISILLFCSTGIILPQPDASLSSSFTPQGLFPPVKCISSLLFFFHRDYFRRPDSSLSSSFAPQGLFPPVKCISSLLFSSTGMISAARMHLYLPLLLHRDYFAPVRCVPTSEKNRNLCFFIKFRFHVQSTAQLNYLLSTIVYVPDSKFTFNVANALLYSQRISRDLSPPEIATSAPSENALWVFRMRINASCF